MHSRAECNDNVVRSRVGHRVRTGVYTEKEGRPDLADGAVIPRTRVKDIGLSSGPV